MKDVDTTPYFPKDNCKFKGSVDNCWFWNINNKKEHDTNNWVIRALRYFRQLITWSK